MVQFASSCSDSSFFKKKDPVVAEVGERKLFFSQLKDIVPDGTSKKDSLAIVDGYIENWVRERLMVEDAAEHIAADINLDKLVDDYRSSLLVYHYENRLTSRQLDTMVAEVEMREYYESHKGNYVLTHPAFRCIIARVPASSRRLQEVKNSLQKVDYTEALFLVRENAVYHQIDTSLFMTYEDIATLLPENMVQPTELRAGMSVSMAADGFVHFLKILSFHAAGEAPPFEYISEKIKKTVLSERRIQLLKKYRQDLYNEGLEEKRFKIFKID
jgi:hypothetical protein